MAIETHKINEPELEPSTSAFDFFDMRDHLQSFSAVAGISPVWNEVLLRRGPAEHVESLFVSSSFFPMLGMSAARGRPLRTMGPRIHPPSSCLTASRSVPSAATTGLSAQP